MRFNILIALFTVLVFTFAVYIFTKSWNLGKTESDFAILCLNNHEYFRASFGTKGFLAINLDDNGKPIMCKRKK